MFADSTAMEWQQLADGLAMKMMAAADGKVIAQFKFDAGYEGGKHHHEEPEFTYVLEGSIISNGVEMLAGHAYAAQAGTDHEEFRSETGAVVVSVFKSSR